MKKYLIIMMVMLLLLTGCGSNAKSQRMEDSVAPDYEEGDFGASIERKGELENNFDDVNEGKNVFKDAKVIQTADINLETLEFEKAIEAIEKKVMELDGYIQNSNVSGTPINYEYESRNAHFVLRIPKENYDIILNDLSKVATVVNKSERAENVTLRYYDSKARIDNLKIEETTLKELLKKADNMQDIIIIQERLSELRYEIESLQTDLKNLDHLVDYSTIYVYLTEVEKIKEMEKAPKTLGEKIKREFNRSKEAVSEFYEDASVYLVGGMPKLIIFIPIILIIYIIIRLLLKRFKKVNGNRKIRREKKIEEKKEKDNKE